MKLWKKALLIPIITIAAWELLNICTYDYAHDWELREYFSSNHTCITECRQNYTTICHVTGHTSVREETLDTGEIVIIASHPVYEISSDDRPDDIWMVTRIKWTSEWDDGCNWRLYRKWERSKYIEHNKYVKIEWGMNTIPISFPKYKRKPGYTESCIWINRPYDSCSKYCE